MPELRNNSAFYIGLGHRDRTDLCAVCHVELEVTRDEPMPMVAPYQGEQGYVCRQCLAREAPSLSELLPLEVH